MEQKELPALKDVLKEDFFIGAAVTPGQLDGVHRDLLTKHFNTIVAENVMKPEWLAPEPDLFIWEHVDKLISFSQNHHMKIRFHTLVWHNQTPDWFFKDKNGNEMTPTEENKELLLTRLKTYITTVVERYRDDIHYWDVVNEVIDPDQPNGMRQSKWYQITGIDFIKVAFQTVRQVAGPDTKLYINDFNSMRPGKREFLFELVKDLLDQGIPVDGIGHQMHVGIEEPPTLVDVEETLKMFADLDLDNQITEMDVSVYNNSTDKYDTISEDLLVKQGYRYRDLFDVFRKNKDMISAVVTWGIADDHTWKRHFPIDRLDLPLLFNEQLQVKDAFWGIVDPLQLPAKQ